MITTMSRIPILLLAAAVSAQAKLPELDTIFYGQVRHNTSEALVPVASDQIVVIARLNGVTIATASVAPGASNYVLKVPMDDGVNPRLPGTARFGERVRVFLRSNVLGQEHQTMESAAQNGFPVAASKGEIIPAQLSVAENLSGGVSGMAEWLSTFSLPAGSGDDDSDGDGADNAAEYAAGTDPTDGSEVFRIIDVTKASGNNFIKFGPIRPSRLYRVWCSENLGTTGWSNIGQVTPGVTGDYFLFGHPTPSSPNLFYRLEVHAP